MCKRRHEQLPIGYCLLCWDRMGCCGHTHVLWETYKGEYVSKTGLLNIYQDEFFYNGFNKEHYIFQINIWRKVWKWLFVSLRFELLSICVKEDTCVRKGARTNECKNKVHIHDLKLCKGCLWTNGYFCFPFLLHVFTIYSYTWVGITLLAFLKEIYCYC